VILSGRIDCVREAERAANLLLPVRLAILDLAREPASASEIAARLGQPRQRINYHVRLLARAGFLRKAGRRRRRNMIEQRYVASAGAILLAPELLGPVAPDWTRIGDPGSAAYLIALASQMEQDLVRAGARGKPAEGGKETALTFKSQFSFADPPQRDAFVRALRQAVVEVIARFTSPAREAGPSGIYRLILGCYPYPSEPSSSSRPR